MHTILMGWLLLQMKKIVLRCVFWRKQENWLFSIWTLDEKSLEVYNVHDIEFIEVNFLLYDFAGDIDKKKIKRLKKTVSGG